MNELSSDHLALIIIGTLYLLSIGVFSWILARRANALLKDIQRDCPQEFREELGTPTMMRDTVGDPKQRWLRFIKSGRYRTACNPTLVSKIDSFRSSTTWGLVIFTALGCGILYLFWTLIKPKFL